MFVQLGTCYCDHKSIMTYSEVHVYCYDCVKYKYSSMRSTTITFNWSKIEQYLCIINNGSKQETTIYKRLYRICTENGFNNSTIYLSCSCADLN